MAGSVVVAVGAGRRECSVKQSDLKYDLQVKPKGVPD